MVKQQAQTKMTKDWLAGVEEEEIELKTKVRRLETFLDDSAPSSIKELQVTETSRAGVTAIMTRSSHVHSH